MARYVFYNDVSLLQQRMSHMFNNPKFCDVVVSGANGQTVHCLKCILCCQSDVFEAMLGAEMLERSTNKIHIEDVDFVVLKEMMCYMHTGKCLMSQQNFFPLKALANRYNVKNLCALCAKFEKEKLKLDKATCCVLLNEALQHHVKEVEKRCAMYILDNLIEVCETRQYKDLGYNAVCALKLHATGDVLDDSFSCVVFIKAFIKWIEARHVQRKQYKLPLLQDIDLDGLRLCQLAHLSSYKCIQETATLRNKIAKQMGTIGQDFHSKTLQLWKSLKSVKKWTFLPIQKSSWVYIVARGGKGIGSQDHMHRGAQVEGAVYLEKGWVLKILIGAGYSSSIANCQRQASLGGGGSCVILQQDKDSRFLFVAGGGGTVHANLDNTTTFHVPDMDSNWCDAAEGQGGCGGKSFICVTVTDAHRQLSESQSPDVHIWEGRTRPTDLE